MSIQIISSDLPNNLSPSPFSVSARSIPEDTLVADAATRQLANRGYAGLRTISCEYHEGMLILRGVVASYYLKQLAQEIVHRIEKVHTIVNAIDVVAWQPRK